MSLYKRIGNGIVGKCVLMIIFVVYLPIMLIVTTIKSHLLRRKVPVLLKTFFLTDLGMKAISREEFERVIYEHVISDKKHVKITTSIVFDHWHPTSLMGYKACTVI